MYLILFVRNSFNTFEKFIHKSITIRTSKISKIFPKIFIPDQLPKIQKKCDIQTFSKIRKILSSFRCQLNWTFAPLFSWSKKRKKMSNYTPSIQIHIKLTIYITYKITSVISNQNFPTSSALSLLLSCMGSLCLGNLREKLQISQISRIVFSREIPKSWCPKILKFPTSRDPLFRNSSIQNNIKICYLRKC